MDLEAKNKEWLAILKIWAAGAKNEGDGPTISRDVLSWLPEFEEKRACLEKHVELLTEWLSKNDIRDALKRLPSVGKLLAFMCKLPFIFTTDSMSTLVVECMLRLSDLLTAANQSTDSSSQRAKSWTIKHFNELTSISIKGESNGVDKFLMDEFGVSQHEYMFRHLETLSSDLVENHASYEHHQNQLSSNDNACENEWTFLHLVSIIGNEYSTSILDRIIQSNYNNNRVYLQNEFFRQRLLQRDVFCILSSKSLVYVFVSDVCLFERYIVRIIETLLAEYPRIDRGVIERILIEHRVLELLVLDERLLIGLNTIVKDTFSLIGANHVLVMLLGAVNAASAGCSGGIVGNAGVESVLSQQKILHNEDNDVPDKSKENMMFNLWFIQAKNVDVIHAMWLGLFNINTEELQKSIELLIWFYRPECLHDLKLKRLLVSHVKTLKRFIPKKHLESYDLCTLVSNLKKSLPNTLSAIVIVLHVVFASSCVGVRLFLKELFSKLVGEDCQESMFWFLYTNDMLTKSTTVCKDDAMHACRNQVEELERCQQNEK